MAATRPSNTALVVRHLLKSGAMEPKQLGRYTTLTRINVDFPLISLVRLWLDNLCHPVAQFSYPGRSLVTQPADWPAIYPGRLASKGVVWNHAASVEPSNRDQAHRIAHQSPDQNDGHLKCYGSVFGRRGHDSGLILSEISRVRFIHQVVEIDAPDSAPRASPYHRTGAARNASEQAVCTRGR